MFLGLGHDKVAHFYTPYDMRVRCYVYRIHLLFLLKVFFSNVLFVNDDPLVFYKTYQLECYFYRVLKR